VQVEDGGVNEAADTEDAAELVLGEAFFEAVHGKISDLGFQIWD